MQGNPLLILDTENGKSELKIEYLTAEHTERELNGESSYHIFHVSLITELLLRELGTQTSDFALSEEDIVAIATASATHDVGKSQIPKSILNHPGSLSPVEYDIVKKHAAFGEEILLGAERTEQVSEKLVSYAAQIAKYHHERVDGTGYPEGLKGEDIPLWAQAVAIADAFDALTSARSYKQAFAQDVALQMISSGMCGAFAADIVACLMRVVNNQALLSFNEKMQKMRSVTEEYDSLNLKRVLLIGNTEYIDGDFVKETFPNSKVLVVGNSELEGTKSLKLFRVRKPSIESILETYEFDLIVFFATGLSFQTGCKSDAEELREVLTYSAKLQKKAKLLYFSPLDVSFEDKTDRAIMAAANEHLCDFYAARHTLDIKTVRIPYLYSGTCKKDFLCGAFEELYNKKTVQIPESPMARMHFISVADLSELVVRIVDNWKSGGALSVGDEFGLTFADLGRALSTLEENAKVEFTEAHCSGALPMENTALRNEYGWYAKFSIIDELGEQYARFLETKQKKSFFQKAKDWIEKHELLVKTVETVLLFLLSELLIRLTGSTVAFSTVDFRTIFIVVIATLYGTSFGIASAFLASVSYFIARIEAGTNALTIFYEPSNWVAFVLFFLIGGLCGYVHLKKQDQCDTLEEKSGLLEDKLSFTSELYEDTLQEKKALKKQIISSKDSFGKIFDITRKLNTVAPQELYLKIVETFEDVLENKSIAVYSTDTGSAFGRLAVASRDLVGVVSRSIAMEDYAPVIAQFKEGGIFKNTDLDLNYPMYAAGIYRGDKLMLMIFLWHADLEQRSLYYVNLFKILCDLAQMSLLRAHDYSVALYEKQYVPKTRIMAAEYFEECAKNFAALSEKKVSFYVMLEFDLNGHSLEEADAILAGKIRTTDILGLTAEGKLRLILSQATEADLPFILPRFEGLDIIPTVLDRKDEI